MKAELIIYEVQEHFTQPFTEKGDYSFYEYTDTEIEELSDEDFIESAENNGLVYSLNDFLRAIERQELSFTTSTHFRAFLVDIKNPMATPVRVDLDEMKLNVIDNGFTI